MPSGGVRRLVVEADVAADDRHVERAAGLGEAVDRARELVHDLRALGVPEVQAVGDADRLGAGADEVAAHLGDGHLRALFGGELDEAAVAVDREGEVLVSVLPSLSQGTRTTAASEPGRTTVPPRTM